MKIPFCTLLVAMSVLFIAANMIQAQEFQDSWRWTTYQAGTGLESVRVFDVVETKDGTVWALTQSGIAWSEGYDWNMIGAQQEMPATRAWAITAVSDSEIVATFSGEIFLFGRATRKRLSFLSEGKSVTALCVAVTSDRQLILADTNGMLWESRAPYQEVQRSNTDDPSHKWRWLWNSREGKIWGTADDGLYQYDAGRFILRLSTSRPLPPSTIIREIESGAGIIQISDPLEIRGVWSFFSDGKIKPLDLANGGNIEAVDILWDGRRIITYGHGDVRLETHGTLTSLPTTPPQMDNVIFMHSRSNGDLWVGSESGLSLYRRKWALWDYWKYPTGDLRNQIAEIISLRDGSIWIASGTSIQIRYPNGNVKTLTEAAGIPLRGITAMAEDSSGNVWLGSGAGFFGALRWDGVRWKRFADPEGLGAHGIHRIWKDHRGRLWFLGIAPYRTEMRKYESEPGAFVYENGKFTRWSVEEGLVSGRVYDMTESPDGALWFATVGGISRWKHRTWRHWRTREGLVSDRVFTITSDAAGNIWFGDQNNGLGLIDTVGTVTYSTSRDGLLNDAVWKVQMDEQNRLWCSTVSGLACYLNGVWSKFDVSTGLASVRLWPILLTPERVYVGTRGGGVAMLNRTVANSSVPRVVMSKPIVENGSIFARWSAYSYYGEIPFRDIECRTKLDDDPWSKWSTSRERVFVDVSSGEHQLSIQTKNLFGVLGPESRTTVVVPTPWYRRGLFHIAVSALVILLYIQVRSSAKRRREQNGKNVENERRYRGLFEDSPIAIWEEDFSEVVRAFAELRSQGVTNIRKHLETHPGETSRIACLIRIVDVNRAAIALYHSSSKEAMLRELQQLRAKSPGSFIRELLCRLSEGATNVETEIAELTSTGEPMYASVRVSALPISNGDRSRMITIMLDVTERKRLEQDRENLIANLEETLTRVKTLRGLIPICSSCKKIRDDKGTWNFLEQYLMEHSTAVVSHGLCPNCAKKMYPDVFEE
jgi:PAS domain S-box-containing protein